MSAATVASMVYFGKIRSRGDFVRSAHQPSLTRVLDRWLTQGVELMAADPRWKEVYDQTVPLHFAFLGVRSRIVLAGHLIASADTSGRRFPFVVASGFEVDAPLAFMARSPLVLARLWAGFERAAGLAAAADDATSALAEINQASVPLDASPQADDTNFRNFLDRQTVGALEAMVGRPGQPVSLRRMLLALGLLLQPVPASGSHQLSKGLSLPLPADPQAMPCVATFWIRIVSRFLERGDFELVLFVRHPPGAALPTMEVGFSGGSPTVLHAMLNPQVGRTVFVDISDSQWVESQIAGQSGIRKLSSYLEQPQLSLHQALATFSEVFH